MANRNTVADVINRQNNGQPLSIITTTSLHQAFQINGSQAVLTLPSPMAAIDTTGLFPGLAPIWKPFLLRAAGYSVAGAQFNIDFVNSATALTPVIASSGLFTNGVQNDAWFFEVQGMWEQNSGKLRGKSQGFLGGQLVAAAALIGPATPATVSALQFSVAVTIANANANTQIWLTEFSADYQ